MAGKVAQAQEYLCCQAERDEGLADQMSAALEEQPPVAFSWIRGRTV